MAFETVNPKLIEDSKGMKVSRKGKAMTAGPGFDSVMTDMLGYTNAMTPAAMTAAGMYAPVDARTALTAAFTGMSSLDAELGGYGRAGVPSYATGFGGTGGAYKQAMIPGADSPVIPTGGTGMEENFSQMDMINTMNQNNLKLLELQAVMQNNMQSWNTKSNILSADHRAKMAMIEKFTAR